MTYRNPVIPGFHPDPSVCRVGEDYYLVTSSFEYFPGVPLFHSKDLVNWRQIGHCLTRAEQLDLSRAHNSGGVYAPTLRQLNGKLYMTTTNVSGGGNFYVHTDDPFGQWSDAIFVDQPGIDPDLFLDEDGTAYYTNAWNGGIYQSRIDLETGRRLTETERIWGGSGGQHPEAPHLFRIGEWYYLLTAEGGTEYGHMATIARSRKPDGPFEGCPYNPILTHRSKSSAFHATGHADLVQTPDGDWWAVFLGIRPVGYPYHHHLGRETFLAPVSWTEDGWPIIGDHGMVSEVMPSDGLSLQPVAELPVREDFNDNTLAPHWNFLRMPHPDIMTSSLQQHEDNSHYNWSLTEQASCLTLYGTSTTLNDELGEIAFVGRRHQHFDIRSSAHLTFSPQLDGEEAGIVVYMNNRFHYEIAVTRKDGKRKLIYRRRIGSLRTVENEIPWSADNVILTVTADKYNYRFWFSDGSSDTVFPFGQGECSLLATEVAGGFTGVMIAMYATGNGVRSTTPAHFDWFDYERFDEQS